MGNPKGNGGPKIKKPLIVPTGLRELGYLAGIIDGEGCISAYYRKQGWDQRWPSSSRPYLRARVIVGNTSKELIDWLAQWGGNVTEGTNNKRNPKWSPNWNWAVDSNSECHKLLSALVPHLIVKRKKALEVLEKLSKTAKLKGVAA